ncbi:MAG: hypothetical protein WC101_02380 [Candidatus Gracilibacteria bacterium]
MENLLQNLVDHWVTILAVVIIVIAAATAYLMFLSRLERRVRKAWLDVYECFLSRSDKAPLLVEFVRDGMKDGIPDYESLLDELIVARGATANMALPDEAKRLVEKSFEEVLLRVIGETSEQAGLKKNAHFLALLKEFDEWNSRVELLIVAYLRTLRIYKGFAFGSTPEGYGEFEY